MDRLVEMVKSHTAPDVDLELPLVPRSILRCLDLLEAPDFSFAAMAALLASDARLASQLVQVASTSGAARAPARSTEQAIARLGTEGVRTGLFEIALRPLIDTSTRTALFLGRLYPVKGLPMLIEAWARIRPKGWRLRIAGPDEAGHRAALEAAVRAAALGDVISFFGEVRPHEKSVVYGAADLFILPSHSESFGMVVAEALAHELPVLTTRNVPWPELAVHGCGWSVDANADALARGLRMATAHEPPMLRAMGAKGRAWMAAEFGWDAIARRFIAAYEQAVLRA